MGSFGPSAEVFDFGEFFADTSPDEIRSLLVASTWNRLQWRADSAHRVKGGSRRTFVVNPADPVDACVFSGGPSMRRLLRRCVDVADVVMQKELGVADWRCNRVVVNRMPANSVLPEHPDPAHFRDGVVVVGIGRALLRCESGNITTEEGSLMVIPNGMLHGVHNFDRERFSIALVDDAKIDAGQGIARQGLGNLVVKAKDFIGGAVGQTGD